MARRKLRLALLFGGRSGEHEVSRASAAAVLSALDPARYDVTPIAITQEGRWLRADGSLDDRGRLLMPTAEALALSPQPGGGVFGGVLFDVVFPVLHGPFGEDGTVQGLLELADLPYVGAGVLASAVGMDKAVAKAVFAQARLPQVDHRVVLRGRWRAEPDIVRRECEVALPYPWFVKPANMGSSVGISKVCGPGELPAAFELAADYDRKVIIEAGVPDPREIELSVLGNDDPRVSLPGEVVPSNDFYDYRAKYVDDASELIIPADLSPGTVAELQALALRAFRAIDGAGLARVDFLVRRHDQVIFLNEINTMPGFTDISMYAKLWAASGIDYPALVDRLVELALQRHADRRLTRVCFELEGQR